MLNSRIVLTVRTNVTPAKCFEQGQASTLRPPWLLSSPRLSLRHLGVFGNLGALCRGKEGIEHRGCMGGICGWALEFPESRGPN